MTSPNSIGNIMTRLGGLKHARPRRVMPGAEFLEELEPPEANVSGVGNKLPNFANLKPQESNVPESDLGGELTPQGYDVRANNVLPVEQQQSGFIENLRRLGENLAKHFKEGYTTNVIPHAEQMQSPSANEPIQEPAPQPPPVATEQVDLQEGLPPVTPTQELAPAPNIAETPEEAPKQEEQKEPGTYVELGAAQQIYDDPNASPELKSEIERIFNTKLTPQRTAEVNEFEKVVDAFMNKLEGVETALTTREKALLAKVENRDLSKSEQISMALALLAPALIGALIAGKEGFAGGLTEGGKNVGAFLGNRQQELKEADELLPQIALEKSKIAKEKMVTAQEANELKRKINESVPNFALRQLFERDGKILNGKLVLDTGNPLIPLKSTAVRTPKDYDTFREKTLPKLSEKVALTEQGLHLLNNLKELIKYSKEQTTGGIRDYVPLYDTAALVFKAYIPASADTFIDEEGNEVKISNIYDTYHEQLSDMYSQAIGLSGAKTAFKTYREHFKEMLSNPFTEESLKKGRTQLGTVKSQINSVKNKFEDNIIKLFDANGVETSPIKKLFSESHINNSMSENKRKKQMVDEAVKEFSGE